MMLAPLVFGFLLAGCGEGAGDEELVQCSDLTVLDAAQLEECLPAGRGVCPPAEELVECPENPHRIIYAAEQQSILEERAEIITDAATYAALDADLQEIILPQVDFSAKQVLVASTGAASTCGLREVKVQVLTWEDHPHLDLIVEDTSGACSDDCDAGGYLLAIVEVNRSSIAASSCARKRDVCCEDPTTTAACPTSEP